MIINNNNDNNCLPFLRIIISPFRWSVVIHIHAILVHLSSGTEIAETERWRHIEKEAKTKKRHTDTQTKTHRHSHKDTIPPPPEVSLSCNNVVLALRPSLCRDRRTCERRSAHCSQPWNHTLIWNSSLGWVQCIAASSLLSSVMSSLVPSVTYIM